jgi:hypothetical protein
MTRKARSQKAEPFVMLPRDLLESDAWKEQSLMCRRLIDTLMLEHMAHGGKQNGALIATRRQLEKFGLRRNSIASAICEAEELGLADCHRGARRVASTFTLTWLPHRDGSPPSNRWREYRVPASERRPEAEASERPRRLAPKMATKTLAPKMATNKAPKMGGKTASFAPQNGDQNRQNQGPQNGDHSIEVLTRVAAISKEGEGEVPADELFWVPQSWVTGEGFKPALCGIKPQAPERTASCASTQPASPDAPDADAWLRDEFYHLRARSRSVSAAPEPVPLARRRLL